MNANGIFSRTGTKMIGTDGSIGNSSISGATVSGNLNFDATGTTGIRLPAANTLAFHTAGTEDMRITSTGIIAVGTTTPNTTNKLEVSGNVGLSWAGNTFIGMKFNDGNAYKMGMQLNNVTREAAFWTQSADSDDRMTFYTGSTPTERMRITTAGYITTPNQPAFLATSSGAITPGSGVTKVSFASVGPNISSSFSTATSRFTAPIAGTYSFTAIITYGTEGSASYIGAIFYRNGGNILSTYDGKATGQYSQVKNSLVVTLSAGDYIELYTDTNSGSVIYEGGRTYLMGYLLG
jgi:hypothetical protein